MLGVTFLPNYVASAPDTRPFVVLLFNYLGMADSHSHKGLIFIISVNSDPDSVVCFGEGWAYDCAKVQFIYINQKVRD